jgi:DNA-binding transcriptional regulator GbsR (MarR family)
VSETPTSNQESADDAVARFIERFALLLTDAGMQRMSARVFAALLVTDSGRLTAAELAEMLRVSPAAISGAVRYLEQVALVGREREPGARRDHYRVYEDLWYEVFTNRDRILSRWAEVAREGVTVLSPDSPAGARMAETLAFFEFMHKEIPALMDRWHEQKRHASND